MQWAGRSSALAVTTSRFSCFPSFPACNLAPLRCLQVSSKFLLPETIFYPCDEGPSGDSWQWKRFVHGWQTLSVISDSTCGLSAPSTTATAGIRVQNLPAEHIASLQARGAPPNTDPGLRFSLANHLSLKNCKPSGVGTSLASSSWHLLERCDGSLWIPLSSGPSGSSCQLENRRAVGGQHLANKFTQGNNGFHVGFP